MHFGLALWGWSLLEFSTILLGNPSSPRCCCFSVAQSCLTLCNLMDCSTPGFPVHHQLPELAQTHVHQVGDAIQPSHPLLPPFPPALSFSQHQNLFQWAGIKWPKYWSFTFNVSLSSEYLELTSFKIDWLDLLAQGTLKSLLQHHNTKALILQCSAFFIAQFSHPYMITRKTIVWLYGPLSVK